MDTPIIGTWRLLSFTARAADGVTTHPLGPDADALLIYDATGHVSGQASRAGRDRFSSGARTKGTDAEVRAAFEGYMAYFGRYDVDRHAGVVRHHVVASLYPNWVGKTQVRRFELDGDRLVLRSPPLAIAGGEITVTARWRRVVPRKEGSDV